MESESFSLMNIPLKTYRSSNFKMPEFPQEKMVRFLFLGLYYCVDFTNFKLTLTNFIPYL